jgi:hypothetical protein
MQIVWPQLCPSHGSVHIDDLGWLVNKSHPDVLYVRVHWHVVLNEVTIVTRRSML